MQELLSWTIVISVSLGLIAMGFTVLQVKRLSVRDEIIIAGACFTLSAIIVIGRIVYWGITSSRDINFRRWISTVAVAIILLGWAVLLIYLRRVKNERLPKTTTEPKETQLKIIDKPNPNFVYIRKQWQVKNLILDGNTFRITEKKSAKYIGIIYCFDNVPKESERVTGINNVRARLTYFPHPQGDFVITQSNNGCWAEHHLPTIDFPVNKERLLILAVALRDGKSKRNKVLKIFEHSETLHKVVENEASFGLPTNLRVEVTLIPEEFTELSRSFTFNIGASEVGFQFSWAN